MFGLFQIAVAGFIGIFAGALFESPRIGQAVGLFAFAVIVWGTGTMSIGRVQFSGREARVMAICLAIAGVLRGFLFDELAIVEQPPIFGEEE